MIEGRQTARLKSAEERLETALSCEFEYDVSSINKYCNCGLYISRPLGTFPISWLMSVGAVQHLEPLYNSKW